MKTSIQQVIVQKDCPLHHALKQMDEINRKLLIVANNDGTFFSLLSIGDIQRAIISMNVPCLGKQMRISLKICSTKYWNPRHIKPIPR
jgi:hypothetical protein